MSNANFVVFDPMVEYFDPFKIPFSGTGVSLFGNSDKAEGISDSAIETCSACSACSACSSACCACTACGSW